MQTSGSRNGGTKGRCLAIQRMLGSMAAVRLHLLFVLTVKGVRRENSSYPLCSSQRMIYGLGNSHFLAFFIPTKPAAVIGEVAASQFHEFEIGAVECRCT